MARKNVVPAYQMITDGDMSADVTSQPTDVQNLDKASIRITWTTGGSAIGEVKVQAIQEKPQKDNQIQESDWFDLEFGNTISIDSVANPSETNHQLLFNEIPFTKLRLKYVRTSGTGTINAKITAKQVGG